MVLLRRANLFSSDNSQAPKGAQAQPDGVRSGAQNARSCDASAQGRKKTPSTPSTFQPLTANIANNIDWSSIRADAVRNGTVDEPNSRDSVVSSLSSDVSGIGIVGMKVTFSLANHEGV